MEIKEAECVKMKRQGAEYVAQLLLGKTIQEQCEFWKERTKQLSLKQKDKKQYHASDAFDV